MRVSGSLTAEHPGTLPDVTRVLGARPATCALADATCVCTWRFLTKDGAREIEVAASFSDTRATEPETVVMLGPDGNPLELGPDEAERGYRAAEYSAPPRERVPFASAGGEIGTIASEDLTRLLNEGGHVISRRALKAAELEKTYRSWTDLQRLEACISQPGRVKLVKRDGETATW